MAAIDEMDADQLRTEIKKHIGINANFFRMLGLIAKEVRACRGCAVTIYMIEHSNGKIAPYTSDGVNHFANCP